MAAKRSVVECASASALASPRDACHASQQLVGRVAKPLARCGELRGLAAAVEQLRTQPLFQGTDPSAEGWLRHVPLLGCARDVPAANFAELRKYIATNGSKINLANAGMGSASHLCSLMLQTALKSDMTFVPYKGTGPAMNDLLGGQVDLMCEQATNSTPQIEARKVRAYGVTGAQRMTVPALAALPTLAESGLPGFNFSVSHGLYAAKGTPPAVVEKINTALRAALKDPELIKREQAVGLTVVTDGRIAPAEHRKFFESEVVRWTKTIRDSGIQPE